MSLPARHPVMVERYNPGARDAHGNAVDGWQAPVTVKAVFIAPGDMSEPGSANRDSSEIAFTVAFPAGTVLSERDRIVLDGDEYQIDGRPDDWTRGPWPHPTAGVVAKLRRVEG